MLIIVKERKKYLQTSLVFLQHVFHVFCGVFCTKSFLLAKILWPKFGLSISMETWKAIHLHVKQKQRRQTSKVSS